MILRRILFAGGVCLRHTCMPCSILLKNSYYKSFKGIELIVDYLGKLPAIKVIRLCRNYQNDQITSLNLTTESSMWNSRKIGIARSFATNHSLFTFFKLRTRSFYISLHWSVGQSVCLSVSLSKKCQKLSKIGFGNTNEQCTARFRYYARVYNCMPAAEKQALLSLEAAINLGIYSMH